MSALEAAPPSSTPAPAVTPVSTAPVAAPSQAAVETPSSSGSASVQAAPSAPDVQAPSMIEAKKVPEYDWEKWDGKADALPEEWRDPVSKASKFYQDKYADYDDYVSKYEDAESKAQEMESLYNSVIESYGKDPRFDELNGKYETQTQEYTRLKEEHAQFQQQVDAWHKEDAKSYAENLAKSYPKYFTDDAAKAKLSSMLKEDWDPEVAVKVLELGDAAVEAAKSAKSKGAPDALALEFAELSIGSRPKPQKREAAQVMAGAEPAAAPARAQISMKDAKSGNERRLLAAERALSVHRGGR